MHSHFNLFTLKSPNQFSESHETQTINISIHTRKGPIHKRRDKRRNKCHINVIIIVFLLTRLNKDALLYRYIPSILFAWHLVYEVFKLFYMYPPICNLLLWLYLKLDIHAMDFLKKSAIRNSYASSRLN